MPMFAGMVPVRLLYLRSSLRRFGKEEKSKFWRVPLIPVYARSISVTLPSLLQLIPYHLHGLERVELACTGETHDSKTDWFGTLFFHLSRASTSVSALQKETKTTQERKFANETQSFWLAIVGNSGL